MRSLGKGLQLLGLVILPLSMLMQLSSGMRAAAGDNSVSAMLLLMVFGAAMFGLGRIIEGYSK